MTPGPLPPRPERLLVDVVEVERTPETLRLTVTPNALVRLGESLLLLYGILAALAFALLAIFVSKPGHAPLAILFYSGLAAILVSFRRFQKRHRPESLYCFPAGLEISSWSLVGKRRLRWLRASIAAVGAWDGLLIVHQDGRCERLFAKVPLATLRYLLNALRTYLPAGERLPFASDEIPVYFSGSFWDAPLPGVLHVAPGRLALRYALHSEPHLVLRTSRPLWSNETARLRIALEPTDIVCRVEEGQGSVLTIAPDGVRAEFKDGNPRLRLPLLGPLLQRHQEFPRGCAFTENLVDRVEDFEVTIQCDDPNALQAALGRFWGDGER